MPHFSRWFWRFQVSVKIHGLSVDIGPRRLPSIVRVIHVPCDAIVNHVQAALAAFV
jgi:hypothetical protein